jgi:hypothetical protein
MRLVAALFLVVQAVATLGLVMLSVHGGVAVGYLALSSVLVAWALSRKSWPLLLGAGALMVIAAPAGYVALDQLDRRHYEQRVAATRVSDLHDEPIVSPAGRRIGVRLSFAVSVPENGSFAIAPTLYGTEGLHLSALQRSLDGRADARDYQAGRVHRLSADLYPPIVMRAPDGTRCLSPYHPPLPEAAGPVPLRISIHETPYAGHTGHAYNLPQLYRNVLAENLPACKAGL